MPVPLGYVEVRAGISTASPTVVTKQLDVLVSAPPLNEPSMGPFGNLVPIDLPGGIATDLQVSVTVSLNSDTDQRIEFFLAPVSTLTDIEVRLFVNTLFLTNNTDYGANPTPADGEPFIMFGYRSATATPMPAVAGILGVHHGTGAGARDEIDIQLTAPFTDRHGYIVGQLRMPTASATFTAGGGTYRRADEASADGMQVDLVTQSPGAPAGSWLAVKVGSPRTGDSPRQEVGVAAGPGVGDVPTTGKRRYRVTYVFDNGNESSPTPPSAPIAAPTGEVRVDLPVWVAAPPVGQLPAGPPVPVVRRRVYRTVTSDTGDDGEYFLVDEVPDNTTATFTDRVADEDLGDPVLTDLTVDVVRSADKAGTQLLSMPASLEGSIALPTKEKLLDGTVVGRGVRYDARVEGVPARASVVYNTRPAAAGDPRVTWRTTDHTGAGAQVGLFTLTTNPLGLSAGVDKPLRARVERAPSAIGADWLQRGATRLKVVVGHADDPTTTFPEPVGLVAFHIAAALTGSLVTSPKAISVLMDDASLRVAARGPRRFRLLLGLEKLAGEPGTHLAQDDDGVVVDLVLAQRSRDERPDRSLVFIREAAAGSVRLVEARAGALPDEVHLDLKPSDPLSGILEGRIGRLTALVQGPGDAHQIPTEPRRHDGIWAACPDTLGQLRLDLDTARTNLTVTTEGAVRVDAAARRPAAFTDGDLRIAAVQATVTGDGCITLDAPPAGSADDDHLVALGGAGGLSGRVAVARATADDTVDRFLAVRATPQVRLDSSTSTVAITDVTQATARVLGFTALEVMRPPSSGPHHVAFNPNRANTALRARLDVTDGRFTPATWSLAKVRVAAFPDDVAVTADLPARSFLVDTNRRSGQVVLFAEPPIVPSDGAAMGVAVGVGLARATISALPTHLQLDLLGPDNPQQDEPFNWSPPAGWRKSGFRIETDGDVDISGLQMIDVSHTAPAGIPLAPIPPGGPPSTMFVTPAMVHFWSNTAAAFIGLRKDDGDGTTFGPVFLWTPSEGLPGSSATLLDWSELESALGWRIETDTLMTLQLNSYADGSMPEATPRRWNSGSFSWLLMAEVQMKDYRGEGTLSGGLSPEGNPDSGPGQWWVRVPDAGPWFDEQICFGNTGGTPSNRPRIFAPFTP